MADTKKLSDLKPLKRNPNKGSERGQYMLEESFNQAGAGRSILIAANGDILAGNHASEVYGQVMGNEDVIIVPTDGKTLVAVQRTDIPDANDPRAKTLIIADNRASDVHEYDAQVLAELLESDKALLETFFREDELDNLLNTPDADDWLSAMDGLPNSDRSPFQQMTFTLHDEQVIVVNEALKLVKDIGVFTDIPNENSNGNALALICAEYIRKNG